jgi:hypothetical protein
MGAGAAFFDYDDDGLVDLYLVDGFDLPDWTRQIVPINLARQDQEGYWVTEDYAPPLRFEGQADSAMYALTQATSQNSHRNRLYRNQGHGRFADVSHKAGVGDTFHHSRATASRVSAAAWAEATLVARRWTLGSTP